MNERIKELESQCWEERAHGSSWFNVEKFAELIVRDIVFGLRDNANCLVVTGSVNEAFMFRTYATGLEKQYGIKE